MSRVQRLIVNSSNNRGKLELVEKLLELAPLDGTFNALEIGCGAGYVAAGLSERYGASVTGTDVDPEQIRIARERHGEKKGLSFLECDASCLPFADEEFDLVIMQMVLHHITEWAKTLAELCRVTRTGGIVVVDEAVYTAFTARNLRPLLKGHAFYSENEIVATMNGAGLVLIHQEEQWGLLKFLVRHCILVFEKKPQGEQR